MLDKQKNFINSLGEEIFNLYLNNGFSKVMKTQIDEKVFHTFLLTELSKIDDKKFIVNEEIDYDEISKNDIYKLSLASSLTESLIQSKIEKDFYAYHKNNDSFDLKKFLTKQIQNSKLNKNDIIKDGKIRFIIQNSVLKKKVSNAFNERNIIIDFTFNKDLLVVNVLDVIDILELDNNKNNELLQNSIKAYLPTEKNKNLANEISEKLPEQNSSIKETVINLIKYLGKSAYEKFLDLAFSKIIFGQN